MLHSTEVGMLEHIIAEKWVTKMGTIPRLLSNLTTPIIH